MPTVAEFAPEVSSGPVFDVSAWPCLSGLGGVLDPPVTLAYYWELRKRLELSGRRRGIPPDQVPNLFSQYESAPIVRTRFHTESTGGCHSCECRARRFESFNPSLLLPI